MRDSRYISIAELRHQMYWKGFTHHDINAVSAIIDSMPDAWGDSDDTPQEDEVYLTALERGGKYVYVDILEWSDGRWLKVPEDTEVIGWMELPSVRSLL